MNIKKSLLLAAALIGSASASADCGQALILAKGINSVYWLSGSGQTAVAYRDNEQDNRLKQFVVAHINSENRVAVEHCLAADKAPERLILVGAEQSFEVKVTADCLIFEGNGYFVSSKKLAEFKVINKDKVAQGQEISQERLQAIKSRHFS